MRPAPIGGLSAPVARKLADESSERVRLEHHDKLVELQQLPSASMRVVENVKLVDGIVTAIPHGLGRAAVFVQASCTRNATSNGYIREWRNAQYSDRYRHVYLQASGFGATVTVDVLVL